LLVCAVEFPTSTSPAKALKLKKEVWVVIDPPEDPAGMVDMPPQPLRGGHLTADEMQPEPEYEATGDSSRLPDGMPQQPEPELEAAAAYSRPAVLAREMSGDVTRASTHASEASSETAEPRDSSANHMAMANDAERAARTKLADQALISRTSLCFK
jgi:hypothetical protein